MYVLVDRLTSKYWYLARGPSREQVCEIEYRDCGSEIACAKGSSRERRIRSPDIGDTVITAITL